MLIILIILILLSAFFSGSETAFMNLKLHRKGMPLHVKSILRNEKLFLTSVLSANTVVNISIAVLWSIFRVSKVEIISIFTKTNFCSKICHELKMFHFGHPNCIVTQHRSSNEIHI